MYSLLYQDVLPLRISPQRNRPRHLHWLLSPTGWGYPGQSAFCTSRLGSFPREGVPMSTCKEQTQYRARCHEAEGPELTGHRPPEDQQADVRAATGSPAPPRRPLSSGRVEDRADHSGQMVFSGHKSGGTTVLRLPGPSLCSLSRSGNPPCLAWPYHFGPFPTACPTARLRSHRSTPSSFLPQGPCTCSSLC